LGAEGTGFGVGDGVGFGDGAGAATTTGAGAAVAVAVGLGDGEGDGVGVAVGVADGEGDAPVVTLTGRFPGADCARTIITTEPITESTTPEARIAWVRVPGPRRSLIRLLSEGRLGDEGL
jgi:hypothetical protein